MLLSSSFRVRALALLVLLCSALCTARIIPSEPRPSTPMHKAVKTKDLEKLKELLASDDVHEMLDSPGPGGQTPLMKATLMGQLEMVKALLDAGANPLIAEKRGYTPAHGAAFQGRTEVMRELIARGIGVTHPHSDGYYPAHRAAWGREQKHTDTLKVLVEEAGVNCHLTSIKDGHKSLLELAKDVGHNKNSVIYITECLEREAIEREDALRQRLAAEALEDANYPHHDEL